MSHAHLLDALIEFRPEIQRVVARRVGMCAAADLMQDLFLRLQRITADFPTREDAHRYLVRMALNAATDHLRTERRRSALHAGLEPVAESVGSDPADEFLVEEQISQVQDALAELPDKYRAVLYLSRIEGMTHGEIAEILGISRSLVEKCVVRALMHCRDRLLQPTPSDPNAED